MWITLDEVCVDEPSTRKIHFKTQTGLARNSHVLAFEKHTCVICKCRFHRKMIFAHNNI
ncbi:hypothetical protein R3W88_016429 [Solanum pinnatisectum]|uniref:Uncharacterized protein n=1 Tax=Solanum pinnatisectum TaxID=50273 RepID=A0AAV9KXC6_9SOLN|nr:hypothetical protein R3W88_016429 [Solanum pinnatisectum]